MSAVLIIVWFVNTGAYGGPAFSTQQIAYGNYAACIRAAEVVRKRPHVSDSFCLTSPGAR